MTSHECLPYGHRLRYKFTRSARWHKIGRAHAWAALLGAGVPSTDPNGNLRWVGVDDRGVELEIVGFVAAEDDDLVMIKHVMPTQFRKGRS